MKAPFLGTFGRTDAEDPLKVFRFHIEIEGFSRFGFQKVGGLEAQTDVTEYREGGQNATVQKSPGLTKFPDLTFERGQVLASGAGGEDILAWYSQVFDVSAKVAKSVGSFRRDIDIVQFNKEGNEVRRWRVVEAWPSQFKAMGDADAESSDNSIESMTVTHEGFFLVQGIGDNQ
jgi:phage tail-like protein